VGETESDGSILHGKNRCSSVENHRLTSDIVKMEANSEMKIRKIRKIRKALLIGKVH
tara:strand:+ start:479 stop:649 length:171 start_codon:yes stop_codon:yes gene_type:complete